MTGEGHLRTAERPVASGERTRKRGAIRGAAGGSGVARPAARTRHPSAVHRWIQDLDELSLGIYCIIKGFRSSAPFLAMDRTVRVPESPGARGEEV